jgi:hypothetical protein
MAETISIIYGVPYTITGDLYVKRFNDHRSFIRIVRIGSETIRLDDDDSFELFHGFSVFRNTDTNRDSPGGVIGNSTHIENDVNIAKLCSDTISLKPLSAGIETETVDKFFANFGVVPEFYIRVY